MLRIRVQQTLSILLAGAFFMLAAGCLVTSRRTTEESGVRIAPATLEQIAPGETTETWLLATAGEPSVRREVDEHTSILRYERVETTSSRGSIFLLFAGGSTKRDASSMVFEVRDGVIQRYWTET